MGNTQANAMGKLKCWEVFSCKESDCPAYQSEDLRCWLYSSTHCHDKIQRKFIEKIEICTDCEFFKENIDVQSVKETFNLVNKQFTEFRQKVNDREDSLRSAIDDLQKRQTEVSAMLEASRVVHEYQDFIISAKAIFYICKNLIGATSGYVALLSKDGNENEILLLDSGGLNCAVDPKLPMPIRGLRAEAYRKSKAVFHNDFSNSKFMKFIPKGHARLNNVLFAPMNIKGKAVGLIGLANKPEGFTENDARLATAFGELSAIALINKRSEEALTHERNRATTYFNIAGVILVVIGADQKVTLINKRGCEILGYDETEIIGKNWFDTFIPNKDRDEVKTTFKKVIVGEVNPVEYFENPVLTKNKGERTIAWHNTFLRDEDSKIIATLSSGEDITEQKRAQDALQKAHKELEQRVEERTFELANAINSLTNEQKKLREAELRYRTVADFTYDWEYWESQSGTILYISPSCQRITGYKKEEFIKNPALLQDIILSQDKEIWSEHRQEASAELKLREVQFRIRTRDGQIRWIEHACQPVKDNEGNFLGYRASNRDITERKKIEESLIKSEERLKEAQEIAHLGNWYWDMVRNELSWTDEIYRIFGLGPNEFGATYDAFLKSVHPEDRQVVKEAVKNSLADPDIQYSIEHRVVRPDGSERIVHERGKVIFDSDSNPIRMVGTVHDITELKKSEEALKKAYSEIKLLKDKLEAENIYLREEIRSEKNYREIIGISDPLKYVLFRVEQVARTDSTVLILGETGTGKALIAHAIHNSSPRSKKPFVNVNCAALPANLIESELFGREKGAFTGAQARQIGRFELANGGTIFLDEIGEMPLELQTKLLRVLQDGEFERLGSPHTIKVNVRVIASTNRDLKEDIKKGRFRQDLYYRLNVFPIMLAPLRERREDIPLLVNCFLEKYSKKMGKTIPTVSKVDMRILQSYSWPGNVRELENVMERAVIITQGSTLQIADSIEPSQPIETEGTADTTLQDIERKHILRVLEQTHWRIAGENGAATILGLNSSTLRGRIKKLGIKRI